MEWPQPSGAKVRGSLLFANGRGDFIEKYLEAYARLACRRLERDRVRLARPGLLARRHAGGAHASFDPLIDDLAALIADWRSDHPGPHVAVGHSMGGHMLLRTLVDRKPALDAAVLVAPMIVVNSAPHSASARAR